MAPKSINKPKGGYVCAVSTWVYYYGKAKQKEEPIYLFTDKILNFMIPKIISRLTQLFSPMQNLSSTTLQDLPNELVYEIFSYLPLTEVVYLHSECIKFHNIVVRMVVDGVRNLANRIMCEIQNVKKEMQTSSASADSGRLDFSTVLTYLRCMLTEAALLRASVGHYIDNESAQILLLEPLSQILQEFYSNFITLRDSTVRKIIRADYSSPGITNWNNFLRTFDSNLRIRIEEVSGIVVPVEVIIADLLHCSVSANLQTNFLCSYEDEKYSLNVFFQLKDISHKGVPPDFNNMNLNDTEKQNKLIKYLRSLIRYENRSFVCKYVRELNELENLIVLSGPNVVLDDVFEKLQNTYSQITLSPFKSISCFLSPASTTNNVYNEIHYRANDWDVTKTGITIDFKMLSDKKYLPLNYNYKSTEQLHLSKNGSHGSLIQDKSDTKLGTLIYLSEVPKIDQGLSDTWSTSNEYCDIVICVQYDNLFTLNSSVGKEAEIVFNKCNGEITLIHKEFNIIMTEDN